MGTNKRGCMTNYNRIEKCECVIGMRNDYENADLVTLAGLKEYVEREKRLAESHKDSEWW